MPGNKDFIKTARLVALASQVAVTVAAPPILLSILAYYLVQKGFAAYYIIPIFAVLGIAAGGFSVYKILMSIFKHGEKQNKKSNKRKED